jgi:hypothetical protein
MTDYQKNVPIKLLVGFLIGGSISSKYVQHFVKGVLAYAHAPQDTTQYISRAYINLGVNILLTCNRYQQPYMLSKK